MWGRSAKSRHPCVTLGKIVLQISVGTSVHAITTLIGLGLLILIDHVFIA